VLAAGEGGRLPLRRRVQRPRFDFLIYFDFLPVALPHEGGSYADTGGLRYVRRLT
jgi:hypothetical protein